MSSLPEKSWTEEEKRFLLTEILKGAGISSAYLFSIIKELRISPNWMEIPLPPGRSLKACQNAFQVMEREYAHNQQRSGFRPIAPLHSSPGTRKRPLADLHSPQATSMPRAIQPKPPNVIDPFPPSESRPPVAIPRITDPPTGEPRKKRGRPSKAELQRRAQATQKLGETYSTPAMLSQRRPTLGGAAPTVTTPQDPSQPAGSIMQQHVRPEQISQPRHIDVSTPHTPDMQGRHIAGPELGVTAGQWAATVSSAGPRESTPRTILDSRMPQSPVPLGSSLGPPVKMVSQPGTGSASPEVESAYVSSTAVTGPAGDGTRPVPGMEEGKENS
ncbi:hypothetical protein VTO42DRAFT_3253 [Malbranchea cinnamomea]